MIISFPFKYFFFVLLLNHNFFYANARKKVKNTKLDTPIKKLTFVNNKNNKAAPDYRERPCLSSVYD